MKKIKKQNSTKVALFAGATALMALTPKIHAQTSVDALLDKLEQKGILTVDEAKELRAENEQDYTNDMAKAFNARFPMPDWVTGYKFYGDFRGRFDDITADSPNFVDRYRLRYRLRAGVTVNMVDNLQVGFRLGSGDSAGNPLSNNTTLENNGTKKPVWIDAAYGRWTPINNGTWMLMATIGKMDQPFQASAAMFDPDYTPEGAALNSSYKINSHHSLVFNTAAFVLDEENQGPLGSKDPFIYGAQLIWNANWTPKISSSLGVAALDIVNKESLTAATIPVNNNQGNTLVGGSLVNSYNPIFVDGSVTYKLDSFPLYKGAFPVKLYGEYINNPGASMNNQGFSGGIMFGQSGKKGTWDISYRYQYLEGDAWYEEVVDDDNVAYYPVAFNGGTTGIFGGTNVKGHLIKANYSLTDALTLTFTCYINELIHAGPGNLQTGDLHVMADVMWKF
jgi:Putative porin